MLLIPTYTALSRIDGAGLGLFCRDSVAAETVIWRFIPGFDVTLPHLPEDPVARDFVLMYGYQPLDDTCWIICTDNARHINHSDTPTCLDRGRVTLAARDLEPGTELTCDYAAFCRDPFDNWHTLRVAL